MSKITSAAFWADVAERAVSTAVQGAIGAIGAAALIEEVDWKVVVSTAGLAALLSILKSLAAVNVGGTDASLVSTPDPADEPEDIGQGPQGGHTEFPIDADPDVHEQTHRANVDTL